MENKIDDLEKIGLLLVAKARLYTLEAIAEKPFKKKLEYAEKSYLCIYNAKLIFDFICITFKVNAPHPSWLSFYDDVEYCFNPDGSLNKNHTIYTHSKFDKNILFYHESVINKDNYSLMEDTFYFLDKIIGKNLSDIIETYSVLTPDYSNIFKGIKKPVRFFKMPKIIELDPIFSPEISVFEKPQVKFSEDSFETNVEFFWNLGTREILAAEICGLSVFEYDGFPLDFYFDFIKQMWDETRHANYYLDKSISMFPLAIERNKSSDLIKKINDYYKTGKLPIPKEKNFSETFLDCTVEERLSLLNIRTEAPAVGRLKRKMNSKFANEHLEIKQALYLDRFDEMSHGSNGYKWLCFLYPNKEERLKKMKEVDNMRGILLYISLSEYSEKDYLQVLTDALVKNNQ